MTEETAIPIDHAQLSGIYEEIAENLENTPDKAIADLALEPGWAEVKKLVLAEVERLKDPAWGGETVQEYGFKCLASSLARNKLMWIVELVDATERSVNK